ncbi:MAG: hypothetical protein ACUVSY_17655 [Roseiflexus sp.]
MRVSGIVAANLNNADPCVSGGIDLHSVFLRETFDGIDAAGVAFFPIPELSQEPMSHLQVLLLDVESN